jgi:hypothetical protein
MSLKLDIPSKLIALFTKTRIFLKKVENIFTHHPLVFNGFIIKVGKSGGLFKKKITKGVDGPKKTV